MIHSPPRSTEWPIHFVSRTRSRRDLRDLPGLIFRTMTNSSANILARSTGNPPGNSRVKKALSNGRAVVGKENLRAILAEQRNVESLCNTCKKTVPGVGGLSGDAHTPQSASQSRQTSPARIRSRRRKMSSLGFRPHLRH